MTEKNSAPPPLPSLTERLADQTRQWLVDAAIELLEQDPDSALVNAAIAQRAGVSDRTVYRYFPTRDALVDALAQDLARRLAVPPVPATVADLPAFAHALFASFERQAPLTRAALRPEVFGRMRDGQAAQRWSDLQALMEREFPQVDAEERRMATTTIRYLLAATTWRYYRDNFGFSADEAARCVATALGHILGGLPKAQPAG